MFVEKVQTHLILAGLNVMGATEESKARKGCIYSLFEELVFREKAVYAWLPM